jgi:putative FmdB family regulatory protein
MPIYEYACGACGREFEAFLLRRSDEAEVACDACGARTVSRRMSRPAASRTGASGSGSGAPAPRCGPVG